MRHYRVWPWIRRHSQCLSFGIFMRHRLLRRSLIHASFILDDVWNAKIVRSFAISSNYISRWNWMRHLNNAILNMKVGLVIFRLDVMEAIIELQHHYNGIYKYYFNDSKKMNMQNWLAALWTDDIIWWYRTNQYKENIKRTWNGTQKCGRLWYGIGNDHMHRQPFYYQYSRRQSQRIWANPFVYISIFK